MSGLLALFDDVAAIAKVAAASLDDIAAGAAKAGSKAAGVVIDDAAVTPTYVQGFEAKRELPIIWRIARGSVFNKLVILLPIALLLSNFAPWAMTPLLMLGGAYLCFEGAEKIAHKLFPHEADSHADDIGDPAHLEESKIQGAIKTDFILSAEIMTIALAEIPASSVAMEAATLAAVGVGITALVYGSVAAIVKMDDVGLHLAKVGRLAATRGFGRGLVKGMPWILRILSTIGTAAMLWVGGSILIHGMEVLGWPAPAHYIHDLAAVAAHGVAVAEGFVEWLVKAVIDGVFGLAVGLALMPVAQFVIVPAFGLFSRDKG